jgi:hypothetical protein
VRSGERKRGVAVAEAATIAGRPVSASEELRLPARRRSRAGGEGARDCSCGAAIACGAVAVGAAAIRGRSRAATIVGAAQLRCDDDRVRSGEGSGGAARLGRSVLDASDFADDPSGTSAVQRDSHLLGGSGEASALLCNHALSAGAGHGCGVAVHGRHTGWLHRKRN